MAYPFGLIWILTGDTGDSASVISTIVALYLLPSFNAGDKDLLGLHDSATWPSPPNGKLMNAVLRIEESMLPVTETENGNRFWSLGVDQWRSKDCAAARRKV